MGTWTSQSALHHTFSTSDMSYIVQAMEMNAKPEIDEMAQRGEGTPAGVPLPTHAELKADLQAAHAAAAALEEEVEQADAGRSPAKRAPCDPSLWGLSGQPWIVTFICC